MFCCPAVFFSAPFLVKPILYFHLTPTERRGAERSQSNAERRLDSTPHHRFMRSICLERLMTLKQNS